MIDVFGTRGNEAGQFVRPHGIVFYSSDNMYITDMRNSRIQVFDKEFNLITQSGSYGNSSDQFLFTFSGIDLYENQDLGFVVDKLSTNFQVFDKNGNFLSKFGSKRSGDGHFKRPEYISIDPDIRVFVCDTCNSRIQI
ncbi:MAG: NHL repeat-containing protein [Nitrososphaeraceae archaeon]